MTITHHWHLEQGTAEWLEARRGLITASDFAKLITHKTSLPADNSTSRKYLANLLAERITGQLEQSYQSDDMVRGSVEEPFARQIYAQCRSPVELCGFITRRRYGATLGYSPDGLIGRHGLIEIKRPRQENQIARIISGKIPEEYFWQVHVGLAVSGRRWCDFISYCPGLPMMIERIHRDAEAIDAIWAATLAAECIILEMQSSYKQRVRSRRYPPTDLIQTAQEIVL
jgi:predicted phage-related endonuclease